MLAIFNYCVGYGIGTRHFGTATSELQAERRQGVRSAGMMAGLSASALCCVVHAVFSLPRSA